MNLIIVESPTKAKTISKFVGKDYKVESSFGHIRDLPKNEMGIEIENSFKPKYVIPANSEKTITRLAKLSKNADKTILATDEDREGEAIAWHITEAIGLPSEKIDRIVFHEITKNAIKEALNKPRKIDLNLVDAQQARRILDRLVGYELSPFLWKKVAKGLSAGRVQSVAVRLIVEREKQIMSFNKEEFWTISANLKTSQYKTFTAKLNKINNKEIGKLEINNKEKTEKIINQLNQKEYIVAGVKHRISKKSAPKPFTTSTLQQTANRWLGFSAKQTMAVAQKLYEIGLITYMRTDSLSLSESFLQEANAYLTNNLGNKYASESPRIFKTKSKGAQEAHEAIRPTDINKIPEDVKLDNNQFRLYKLIWQRALASQMPDASTSNTIIEVDARNTPYQFKAIGMMIKFDGYLKIYPEKSGEMELPEVKEKEKLELINLGSLQNFTKPPARYSDAGLVKILERYGIGRPSTYAPTISTIIERNYVNRDENKRLAPTDIAFVVNNLLADHFPKIVDYEFTAQMENDLDGIADGKKTWQPVISEFYQPFHANLENKYEIINKKDIMPEEKSTEICDKCGAPMIIKTGRYGKFFACSAYPKCKNIKSMNNGKQNGNMEKDEKIKELEEKYKNEICDKCGAPMSVRNGKFGPFLGCSNYPKCKNIKNINGNASTGVACPACGQGEIVQKRSRRGIFYACNKYPDCKNAYWAKPTGKKCPECNALLVYGKNDSAKCSNKECGFEK